MVVLKIVSRKAAKFAKAQRILNAQQLFAALQTLRLYVKQTFANSRNLQGLASRAYHVSKACNLRSPIKII